MEKPSNPIGELVAWITLLDAWGLIAIAVVVLSFVWLFWKLNKGSGPYLLADALIDPMTGKASIVRTVIFGCFCGAWAVAFWYLIKGDDIKNYVLAILGIFVTNMIANRAFEVWDPRVKALANNSAPASTDPAKPEEQPK